MEQLINLITADELLSLFIKLFGIVMGLLYLFFAVIMIRQVISMGRTITINDSGLLLGAAYVQVILASVVLFYALFLL